MSMVDRHDLGIQERFSRYYLTGQVASKSCESVYLAHDLNHDSQQVVLKLFETTFFPFDQQSKTFLQKGEKIKQLRHSSVVPVLDLGVEHRNFDPLRSCTFLPTNITSTSPSEESSDGGTYSADRQASNDTIFLSNTYTNADRKPIIQLTWWTAQSFRLDSLRFLTKWSTVECSWW